jgi:hypothetical protein
LLAEKCPAPCLIIVKAPDGIRLHRALAFERIVSPLI